MTTTRTSSITFRGREVYNPAARKAIVALMIVLIPLWIAFLLIAVVVLIVSIPLHFVLRVCGRRGFVQRRGGNVNYNVSFAGFKSAR